MALARWYRNWRRARWLQRDPPDWQRWQRVIDGLPLLQHLDKPQQQKLAELSQLFVLEKRWYPMEELVLDETDRLSIAAHACLPILELGLEWYRRWYSLVIYPGSFLVPQEYTDAAGVLHRHQELRAGEAWRGGPIVLSWEDIQAQRAGYNVIIHECSHKLDMLSGQVNGRPPLHEGMSAERWAAVLGAHFEALRDALARGEQTFLDPYAAEAPEEFFAVSSEVFFSLPTALWHHHPDLYRELARFYRQDPGQYIT